MSDILERAARNLIDRPPSAGPMASELRDRLDRRRHRRSGVIVVVGCLVALGSVMVVRGRDAGAQQPASNAPVTSNTPATPAAATCDDNGCDGLDRLPVAAGASDYYVGPASLGDPTVDLPTFENLIRCSELSTDFTTCVRLEGAAFVGLVSYAGVPGSTEDTTNRTSGSYQTHIGTTFADISPEQYATEWGGGNPSGDNPLTSVSIRGHVAATYTSGDGPAVAWQERPGVLVWVTVPPENADQLMTIAEGIRRTPGPTDIPSRVMVVGTGHAYDAGNNNGDGLVVARSGGQVCAGYGFIDSCSQDIADLTFVEAENPADVVLAGWTPTNVTSVRFSTATGDMVTVETKPFADYDGRFFEAHAQSDAGIAAPSLTHVQWIDAANVVVDQADAPPIDPSVAALGWRSWASLAEQSSADTVDTIAPSADTVPADTVPADTVPADTVTDQNAGNTQQRFEVLPEALAAIDFVGNGDETVDQITGLGHVTASRADGMTLDLTITPGTMLIPENHNRTPLAITSQTDLSLTGRIASNNGWTFDIVVTRPNVGVLFPPTESLQTMLYTLDP